MFISLHIEVLVENKKICKIKKRVKSKKALSLLLTKLMEGMLLFSEKCSKVDDEIMKN